MHSGRGRVRLFIWEGASFIGKPRKTEDVMNLRICLFNCVVVTALLGCLVFVGGCRTSYELWTPGRALMEFRMPDYPAKCVGEAYERLAWVVNYNTVYDSKGVCTVRVEFEMARSRIRQFIEYLERIYPALDDADGRYFVKVVLDRREAYVKRTVVCSSYEVDVEGDSFRHVHFELCPADREFLLYFPPRIWHGFIFGK